jgi:hypothetical protein
MKICGAGLRGVGPLVAVVVAGQVTAPANHITRVSFRVRQNDGNESFLFFVGLHEWPPEGAGIANGGRGCFDFLLLFIISLASGSIGHVRCFMLMSVGIIHIFSSLKRGTLPFIFGCYFHRISCSMGSKTFH